MITVIIPHARPEHRENMEANLARQRGVEFRAIIVCNGAAAGTLRFNELSSTPHQADARNAGLKWLRENGDGAWAMMDDDDYYGPRYLADVEATLLRTQADVVGKRWSFVMFDDGLWRFSVGQSDEWARDYNLTGGTLAARSAYVPDFPRRAADDLGWCEEMRMRGARLWSGSPWHYCYDRRGTHQRVIRTQQLYLRLGFGPGRFYGPQPLSAVHGAADIPYELRPVPTDAEVFSAMLGGAA
jgi:hypothetical protein